MYLFDPSRAPPVETGRTASLLFLNDNVDNRDNGKNATCDFLFFGETPTWCFSVGDSVPFLVVVDLVPDCRDGVGVGGGYSAASRTRLSGVMVSRVTVLTSEGS